MPEPAIPVPAAGGVMDALAAPGPLPLEPPDPDLPAVLRPLHQEYGARWRISYDPLCPVAPYTARPRFGDGRTIRTDTPRLLGRVLTAATPDPDDE